MDHDVVMGDASSSVHAIEGPAVDHSEAPGDAAVKHFRDAETQTDGLGLVGF